MAKEMYCKLAVLYMSVNCGYILKNYSPSTSEVKHEQSTDIHLKAE